MLINFSVSNFGSVKDKQVLSFEATKSDFLENHYIIRANGLRLLKLGLIYGANASGKTTIIRALEFLRTLVLQPAQKKTDDLKFYPFLFDDQTTNRSSLLAIDFIQNDVRYYYEVELNRTCVVREELFFFNPKKASVFKRVTNLEEQFARISFGSKIKIDKTFEKALEANTLWNNTVLGGFIKTNMQLPQLKDVADWFSDYLSPMIVAGAYLENHVSHGIEQSQINKNDVIEILKKADFNVSNIQIAENQEPYMSDANFIIALAMLSQVKPEFINMPLKKIEFEHTINGNKYYLPFDSESHGTRRYYGFAGLLSLLVRHSIAVSIDELESSLHPDLLKHFLLTFLVNSKNSQLIATTHNREILDQRDIFRNDAIWFTEKNEHGATELYSLADFDSKVVRDSSNILNAYKTGKLGGVPDLGDYYIDLTNEKK